MSRLHRLALTVLAGLTLAACGTPDGGVTATLTTSADAPAAGTAAATLTTLAVKGRAAKTGYTRAQFGQAWADVDRNGCDTRNDILNRDLTATTHKPGTHDCVVTTGTLADPYTATTITFTRGNSAHGVDIDHAVALGNAWVTGASALTATQRTQLANDPVNLLAVDSSANRQKGDADAATWLPSNKAYRCAYVARQISVKAKYHLWVTPAEKTAMQRVLTGCTDQPTASPVTASPDAAPESPASDANTAIDGVVYTSCAQAQAAGVTPLHSTDPGYALRLDRDGDGIACN